MRRTPCPARAVVAGLPGARNPSLGNFDAGRRFSADLESVSLLPIDPVGFHPPDRAGGKIGSKVEHGASDGDRLCSTPETVTAGRVRPNRRWRTLGPKPQSQHPLHVAFRPHDTNWLPGSVNRQAAIFRHDLCVHWSVVVNRRFIGMTATVLIPLAKQRVRDLPVDGACRMGIRAGDRRANCESAKLLFRPEQS